MMLKNAPIVILDEATAFTDPENEDKIQRSIAALAKGKTLLPRWMWLINPFAFKILLNLVGKMSTSAFWNGIACSNMSLGALIIFLVWMLILLRCV